MTITVEIPPEQIEVLDRIAAREHVSRNALVQALIAEFVAKSVLERSVGSDFGRFFGSWGDRTIDGLAFQERVRAEW